MRRSGVRIDPEGRWILLAALGAAGVAAWLHPLAALPPLAAGLFAAWFFRDPHRDPPTEPDVVLSPADGRVLVAGPQRISVFMNVFDVHVCRAPIAGSITHVRHVPGRFLAAYRSESQECNERTEIDVGTGEHRLRFALVAGLIARRVVCRVTEGQLVAAGERVGLIRFGSRVDVDLPASYEAVVRRGERVVAGRSILARRRPGGGPSGPFPI
jgi:phosphatidylserine decarboxylase